VGVEREVVGDQRDVVVEQHLQAGLVAVAKRRAPTEEQAVMTSSIWAPSGARSNSSSEALTPLATRLTLVAPGT
jgi:hypothetical protein